MEWFILLLISLVAASFLGVLRKLLISNKKSQTLETIILFQVFAALFILFLNLANGINMPDISSYPINYFITASFWGCAMILLFTSYKYLEASEIAVISTIELVLAIILGNLILNESLSIQIFLGATLIIFSILFLSINKVSNFKFNKGVLLVFGATILAAFAGVNDAFLIRRTDALSYIFIAFLLPGIFVYIVKILKERSVRLSLNKINLKIIILLSIAAAIANLPFYYALVNNAQISQAIPIYKTSVVFTILLSAIFLKERKNLSKKLFSAVLAVMGIILIGM